MTIYFISDRFNPKWQDHFSKFQTILPEREVPYTIRQVVKKGDHYHLLLNEIINIDNPETAFHYSHFTDVPGNVLEWEKVHELYLKQESPPWMDFKEYKKLILASGI